MSPSKARQTLAQIGPVSIKASTLVRTGAVYAFVYVNVASPSFVTGVAAIAGKVVETVDAEPSVEAGTRVTLVRVDLAVRSAISWLAMAEDRVSVQIHVTSTPV